MNALISPPGNANLPIGGAFLLKEIFRELFVEYGRAATALVAAEEEHAKQVVLDPLPFQLPGIPGSAVWAPFVSYHFASDFL